MSRAPSKRQPLDRTILTEFNVQVADIHLRKHVMRGSIAKRVLQTSQFQSGDAVCGPLTPFQISGIQTMVVVQGFRPFILKITYKDGVIANVPCSGYFAFYGELDSVEVTADENTRFSYVAS